MRVLHLFSNAKWTGPAEPALNLCVALRARGVDAAFACSPDAGANINKVVETARDRGIEPILDLWLTKHNHPFKNLLDRRALSRLLRDNRCDLVHCHLDNDHRIAAGPARAAAIPLVRSSYYGLGFPNDRRHARLAARTTCLVEPSQAALENDAETFGFPRERMRVVPGAVDVARFDPARETPDGRRRLNLRPDGFVLGIVARLQTHRHYEDLFEAMYLLVHELPHARLVVVGRGSRQEQVGFEPVQRLNLEHCVHFTGFLDGEDYVGMLRAFDAGVFLTPGSDGTCRAVREMMAMGKPVVAVRRGMLREIVTHERDGLVVDGSVQALHEAFVRLGQHRDFRHALGRAARDTAVTRYSLEAQSAAIADCYAAVLDRSGLVTAT